MKGSYKRFRNFSKLLYNINLGHTQYIRSSKTFERDSSLRKDNSSSNLIKPEIEYVTKLNYYIPKSPNLENKKRTNSLVENKILENKLENRRKELENKIVKIKENLKPLNDNLTKIISEIDNLKLDFEILQNNKTCSIIEKNIKKNFFLYNIISPKREHNFFHLPFLYNKKNSKEEKNKIESILSKHKKDMKSKKNLSLMKIAILKEQKKELIKKIKLNENELKSLREEKNKIKNELITHYHNLLHEGKDIRKDGLSWIILAIWNLKSEVLQSYLPKFLDEDSISFLFNYSKNKIQLKEMFKTLQKITQKINADKDKNKIIFDNNFNNNIITIDQEPSSKESEISNIYNTYEYEENKENNKWLMNKVIKNINKNNIIKNDFFTTRNKFFQTKKESDFDNKKENDNSNNNSIRKNSSFNKLLFNKTCEKVYELYNTKKIIEKKIYKLKNEIQHMVENELERLNKRLYKEGYENKYDTERYNIISAVVGEENARNDINKQINESRKYYSILKKIKKGKKENEY